MAGWLNIKLCVKANKMAESQRTIAYMGIETP